MLLNIVLFLIVFLFSSLVSAQAPYQTGQATLSLIGSWSGCPSSSVHDNVSAAISYLISNCTGVGSLGTPSGRSAYVFNPATQCPTTNGIVWRDGCGGISRFSITVSSGWTPEVPIEEDDLDPPPPPMCSASAPPAYFAETPSSPLNYFPPSLVCHASCQYQNHSSHYDMATGEIFNNYGPTGQECSGEEPAPPLIEGSNYDEACYVVAGMLQCWEVGDPDDKPEYCMTTDGLNQIQCPDKQSKKEDPEDPDSPDVADEDSEVCGWYAGYYQCARPGERQCGYVNGEHLCFASGSRLPSPPDSPDNPANGGNGDGDETNDPTTPSTVGEAAKSTADQVNEITLSRAIGEAIDRSLGDNFGEIVDAINGEGLGGFVAPSLTGFDTQEMVDKGEAAKAQFMASFDTIKTEAAGLFELNLSDAGSLPCPSFQVMGTTYEICISDYQNELMGIGNFLYFLATAFGAFMLVRK